MAGSQRRRRVGLGLGASLLLLLAGAQAAAAFIVPASRIRPLPAAAAGAAGHGSVHARIAAGGAARAVPASFNHHNQGLALLPSSRPRRGAAGALRMLKEPQGSDAFARLIEHEPALGPLHKLSSGPAKLIKFTSIPLAAVGGFLGVPASAGPMFKVFGGVVGALALRTGNRRLRKMRLSGAEVAVAHLLLDYGQDLGALTPSALKVSE